MNKLMWMLGPVAASSLAACADPNTVLFVTNTSIGINFDSKPPTANIAYDRTEGFIGPRYANGGTPPAVASIETGGSIFDPKVQQTYATGSAAAKATKGPTAPDGPKEMAGESDQKKLMFFGTETSVGLKVGFGTTGAPDSLLFGYRRKEASVIPLAEQKQTDGKTVKAVYPSVLAAINVNVNAQAATTTGLTSKQFFATGEAAEGLATNETVAAAFRAKAKEATKGTLTDDQIAAARAEGVSAYSSAAGKLSKITDAVSNTDGSLNKDKLTALVTKANQANPDVVSPSLANLTTVGALRDRISPFEETVNALFAATQ
jgi:hypothetical protein